MTVAVITGAASGIGAGLAREAARRGYRVVLADHDESNLVATAAEIGDAAIAVACDVTAPSALEHLAERAFALEGHVDLLFNNAGMLLTGLSWEIPLSSWQAALDVNIGGIVNGLHAFVPRLLVSDKPARIINTASVGGFLPSPLMAPYCATKFAVVALTEALAGELTMQDSKIAVSLLAPGPVRSGIFREPPPDAAQSFHAGMTAMLEQAGMAPDDFAALVFAAIGHGEYWIIPQPEALDSDLAARNASILARRAPEYFTMDTTS